MTPPRPPGPYAPHPPGPHAPHPHGPHAPRPHAPHAPRPHGLTLRSHGLLAVLLALGACLPGPGSSASASGTSSSSSSSSTSTPPTTSAPVDQPPTAVLALDPKSGPAPLLVSFHGAASSDPEGPLAGLAWTFGDGASAPGASVTHVYPEPGAYDVTLTATDAVGQTDQAAAAVNITADCPAYVALGSPGKLDTPALTEASGLAVSRRSPVLWAHNDSDPDGPFVYAFALDDTRYLGRYALQGASVIDWEDMALGPGKTPGTDDLYLGDIGDNLKQRGKITVYRAPEPPVDLQQSPVDAVISPALALDFTYPGGQAFDAETLLVDPVRGDLCVVTKRMDGLSEVYCRAAPLTSGTLVLAASLDLGMAALATGGAVSPDGRLVAVRTYLDARVWRRELDAPLADAFLTTSCPLALTLEIQGESIAFGQDGLGYFTVSEGESPALHAYRRG